MRVLVASDLSSASDPAVRQGLALASERGAELALCHVLHQSSVNALFPQGNARELELELELQPRVAELLRAQAARVAPGYDGKLDVFIEQGSDYAEIARRVLQWRADLLIVGTHGRSGLTRILLGSVAEHLARHAPCTVLVAREPRPGVVLVATDLSDPSLHALEVGAREAALRKRKLHVVYVMDDPGGDGDAAAAMIGAIPIATPDDLLEPKRELARQVMRSKLERLDAAGSEAEVVDGEPLTEILRLAETLPAELLVIGAKGMNGAPHVLGSTAADIVRGAACSVLAVRPARA